MPLLLLTVFTFSAVMTVCYQFAGRLTKRVVQKSCARVVFKPRIFSTSEERMFYGSEIPLSFEGFVL